MNHPPVPPISVALTDAPCSQGAWPAWVAKAAQPHVRATRVLLLLGAALIVSVADLVMTLRFVTSVGMIEANPIARWIMKSGDATTLTIFKMVLTLLSLGTIFFFRRHRSAEIAAWFCFGVMLLLSLHWLDFVSSVQNEGYVSEWQYMQESGHPAFVMMPESN